MCLSLVAESEKMRTQGQQGIVLKPVKCKVCREVKTNKQIFFFSKSANIWYWSMMQNKNNIMEILRKIKTSKKQQLLSYCYLYNFVVKFVKTNIQK
jgi:hypothetical protein